MAKCTKHTAIIQGLWLLSLVILASSTVMRARVIGQSEDASNTRSMMMTTVGPASSSILGRDAERRPCECYTMPLAFYCCDCGGKCYDSMDECQIHRHR
ncbi:hypothetical protein C2845_PM14G02690 [Panicum miliaceum]|uniref:Uncharacterized protein n=1 Tax=Panicum miliaceum TaxID=4540 RepID=A0A3L6PQ82_PANMI|nr:hypothetical protein C2845_PM14G02690 [Panicum miliaceum]